MRTFRGIQDLVERMDGWLSFAEGAFLYESAKRVCDRGAVVEIGSWKGKSTIWLAHGIKDGGGDVVHAIDPHTGAPEHHEIFKTKQIWTFDEFKENITTANMGQYVHPIVDRSENVAKHWQKPVALLWIDGAHAYEAAMQDFESWFPHLIEGGVMAYHDATYEDVRSVVIEKILFSRDFKNTGIVDTIVFGTKVSPSQQVFSDRIRNRYIYILLRLHGLRHFPLPVFVRRPIRLFFKRLLGVFQ